MLNRTVLLMLALLSTVSLGLATQNFESNSLTLKGKDLVKGNYQGEQTAATDAKDEISFAPKTAVKAKSSGGPDAYGYIWTDSDEAGGPTYSWIDITGTGTPLSILDDGEANITIPFSFQFYGISSADLRVGNNGGIIFTTTIGDVFAGNTALPATSWTMGIMAFWDDIDDETGNVYWEVQGIAPNRQLIIEWYDRPHYSNTGSATFEMILSEGSNAIVFQYADLDFGNALYDNGLSATVGIQGSSTAGDSLYLLYSFNTASLHDNLAIRFSDYIPATHDLAVASIDTPTTIMPPSEGFTPVATVKNLGLSPESDFQVFFQINDSMGSQLYLDSAQITSPDSILCDSLRQFTFSAFDPNAFTRYTAIAWTGLADSIPSNDTLSKAFRTWDLNVGATGILAPAVKVNPESTAVPTATFHNFATQTADFQAHFEIRDSASMVYGQSLAITGLPPGGDTTIVFPDWAAPHALGNYSASAYTVMPHDLNPSNDTLTESFIVGYHQFGDIDTTITIGTLASYALTGITFCQADSNFYFVSMADDCVYRLDPDTWATTLAFPVDNSAGEIPWGISWDGTNFWVGQIENSMIYAYNKQYTFAGTYTGLYCDIIGIGGSGWMAGMDFDGVHTWQVAVGGDNMIYRLDLPNGAVIDTINSVPWVTSQRGCSWIPYTSQFLSGGWNTNLLYKLDSLGNQLDSAVMASMADVDIYDLIAEGEYLWGLVTIQDAANSIRKVWMGYLRPTGVNGNPNELNESADFSLQPAYPNPLQGNTTISFRLPRASLTSLDIYNIMGQKVKTLVAGNLEAGRHSVIWNGCDNSGRKVASGVFICRLTSGSGQATRKLLVIR